MGGYGTINSRDTTDSGTLDTLKSLEQNRFHTKGLKDLAAVIFEFNCLSSAKNYVFDGEVPD